MKHVYCTILKEKWSEVAALKNEFLFITHGELMASPYFKKVKSLSCEISYLDTSSKVLESRMKRIIIYGLRPELRSFIVVIQDWQEQPSLVNLKNLLVSQEVSIKQMLRVSIKKEDDESLFSYKRRGQFRQRINKENKREERYHIRGAEENCDKRCKRYQQSNGSGFVHEKRGHYVKDCWFKKELVEGNITASNVQEKYNSEEEYDAEVSTMIIKQI